MTTDTPSQPRPRLEARRQAFLDAATAVFLEKGYANATLDDVIARSGGSRQTLYALFGGKQGLFEAQMAERCESIFGAWREDPALLDRPLAEVLTALGVRYLETVTTPEALGVYRLVISEGCVMKELRERFWDVGPGRTRALLADYLAQQARRGALRLDDPHLAAQQFIGLLLGTVHMQCLLGIRPAPDAREIAAHVEAGVRLFLTGCGAGQTDLQDA